MFVFVFVLLSSMYVENGKKGVKKKRRKRTAVSSLELPTYSLFVLCSVTDFCVQPKTVFYFMFLYNESLCKGLWS